MEGLRAINQLSAHLSGIKNWVRVSLILGIILNLLSFINPLFMMHIMDSVLPSQDMNTLLFIFGFAAVAFALMAMLESARRSISSKASIWCEGRLTDKVFKSRGLMSVNDAPLDASTLGSVRQIAAFMRNGLSTLIDTPISIISYFVLWLIHPSLVILALGTAVLMISASYVRTQITRVQTNIAGAERKSAMSLIDAVSDAGACAASMGIGHNVENRFLSGFLTGLQGEAKVVSAGEFCSGISRYTRQVAQIAALTIGAIYVMQGEMSGGAMIAGSIILGKALAPFDQLAATWDSFTATLRAASTLNKVLVSTESTQNTLAKITPDTIKPILHIKDITVPRGQGASPILERINFDLYPGECLALVGKSGAGKTTLGDIIAGVSQPPIGEISLDGIPFEQISPVQKASLIGYAPQNICFFPGSIIENISRFTPDANKDDILDAVTRSETTDLIRTLPEGFDTIIDAKGRPLSLGNARRVSLARALFGRPKLVVLDEPSSDLDELGEKALISLISTLKQEGAAIVLIAQRAGLLAVADKLMQLDGGRLKDFGDKNQVLLRMSMKRQQIDLSVTLDEVTRLTHWLGIQLSRVDDGPLRARSEIALIEFFNIIRQSDHNHNGEKISIVIRHTPKKVHFDIYSGLSREIFTEHDLTAKSQHMHFDECPTDPKTLAKMVALATITDINEEITEGRLRTSFTIVDDGALLQFEPEKVMS